MTNGEYIPGFEALLQHLDLKARISLVLFVGISMHQVKALPFNHILENEFLVFWSHGVMLNW